VLEKLAPKYEIANIIMRYRTLEKLQTTYIKALPLLINPYTKKIHTSFNQTITITGRLSSSNPNLQNIPIRSPEGQKIRAAFIGSTKDNIILSADYSQIELRLLAHLAQDENMIQAFLDKTDIHTSTAASIFNIPISKVTKEQRQAAKAVNFGISYGMSAYGLSENLGISTKEADTFIKSYFNKFPRIKEFMTSTIELAKKNGYIKTEFGRWRNIPDILSPNGAKRQFAERTAINTRVQGTSADIIKMAMITIQDRLEKEAFKSHMIIQVHDELVFDVFPEEKEKISALVKKEMEEVVSLSVPLIVNLETGLNWQEIS
jgi:DNA polymerase-1